MRFETPLIPARLLRRYKRFLADVRFDDDGSETTAHVANPGAMLGLAEPGRRIWLSPARNPARKLKWSWELAEADPAFGCGLVGVNTGWPNLLAAEAIAAGAIPELAGYPVLRREVTADRVKAQFAHVARGPVTRHDWPGLHGFNFVMERALGGGGIASLRNDPQGKGYAQALLMMPVSVPVDLVRAHPTLAAHAAKTEEPA